MVQAICEGLDPRIRRTRQLLQRALGKLLETKEFDKISVQDIADSATVNRATFYDHYADKFTLLESLAGSRFQELLVERGVRFDGTCTSALTAIVLAVCDYLSLLQGPSPERRLEPHMESAIIAVVRRMILEGLKRHQSEDGPIPPEVLAAAASWAIYGAAKEWSQTPDRQTSEEIAHTVTTLVSPILELSQGLTPNHSERS